MAQAHQLQQTDAAQQAACQQAPQPKRRIEEFDIARGFAIICVVVGHMLGTGIPIKVIDFCFSFHMPLFFIISGCFMKSTTTLNAAFVKKNARGLLLPYVVTCAFVIVLGFIEQLIASGALSEALGEAKRLGIAALYGSGGYSGGMPDFVSPIGAVWFLLALFWARIFLAAANMTRCPGIIVLMLFAGAYLMDDSLMWLPFSIQAGMGATLFLYIGEKARELGLFERKAIHPVLWVAMLIIWGYAIAFAGKLYMASSNYSDGLIDVVGAICGTMCIVAFSRVLNEHVHRLVAPLASLGKITLPVFCMHLVELDVFPWGYVLGLLNVSSLPWPDWVTLLVLRCILIAIMVAVLWALPRPVSGIYFPSKRKPATAKS